MAALASTMDLDAANAVLKELYGVFDLQSLAFKDRPLLAMLPKSEESGGKLVPVPVQYEDGAGASADYTKVHTNFKAEEFAQFQVVGKTMHHKAELTGDAIASSQGDRAAFVDLIKNSVKSKINALANDCHAIIGGNGTGTLGVISSITTGVIVLTNKSDIVKFQRGQILQATDTDGGTAVAALGYVIAVNRNLGTLTVSDSDGGAAATPTSWSAVNYPYLVVYGNLNAVAKGIPAWLPATTPASNDSFFGVNRSVDSRLYGIIDSGSGKSLEEAIIDGVALQQMLGGKCTHGFVNPLKWGMLEKSLMGRVRYSETKVAGVGFTGIEIMTVSGSVPVYPDRMIGYTDFYGLDMPSWKLLSRGKVPQLNQTVTGGLEWIPVPGQDKAEVRVEARLLALACDRPGHNLRVTNFGA